MWVRPTGWRMPTSQRGRGPSAERWGERHPRVARTVNGLGAAVGFVVAGLYYAAGDATMATFAGGLAAVLLVGVVWPRFSVLSLVLEVLTLT